MLLWNVHMKDEEAREKFRSDLGSLGCTFYVFLKSAKWRGIFILPEVRSSELADSLRVCRLT
jgi:hypothetical protein